MEARAMKRPVHSATALAALAICATLAGCAAPRQPLYAWNDYQPQVYQYLKDDGSTGAEDQLLKLEEARLKVQAEGKALPPGYRAHMAMLYSRTGNNEKTVDRKSTRLNSSHLVISYAVFCLKTKKHDST